MPVVAAGSGITQLSAGQDHVLALAGGIVIASGDNVKYAPRTRPGPRPFQPRAESTSAGLRQRRPATAPLCGITPWPTLSGIILWYFTGSVRVLELGPSLGAAAAVIMRAGGAGAADRRREELCLT